MAKRKTLDGRIHAAMTAFWSSRDSQKRSSGARNVGSRGAVTGGQHLGEIRELIKWCLAEAGVPESLIHVKGSGICIPGYIRRLKRWDITVADSSKLYAAIELKSQAGSYGNNQNNRIEEAIGNAYDLRLANKARLLGRTKELWIGFLFVLGNPPPQPRTGPRKGSLFPMDEAFVGAGFQRRYELTLERLEELNLYNSCCLIASEQTKNFKSSNPNRKLSFVTFIEHLTTHLGKQKIGV